MNAKKLLNSYWLPVISSFVVVISLFASLNFLKTPQRLTPKALEPNQLQLTFSSSSNILPPNSTVRLNVDPANNTLGFVRVEFDFNPAHIRLVNEINTTPLLKNVIEKTSMATANQTGHVVIVLGVDPREKSLVPLSTFELVNFQVSPLTNSNTQTTLSLSPSGHQIVNTSSQIFQPVATPLVLTLNPQPTATRTPTPLPTATRTPTPLPTATRTPTPLPTATRTPTPLPTSTRTPTPLPTATRTPTPLPTSTRTPTPLPRLGDANSDGRVDGLDYIIWLNNYNRTVNQGPSVGDFNRDTKVDGLDYIVWLNNYDI